MSGNDRPIKMNPTGKYNLNFIDWQNEFDRVYGSYGQEEESPIYGMDLEVFKAIIAEEAAHDTSNLNPVQKKFYEKF